MATTAMAATSAWTMLTMPKTYAYGNDRFTSGRQSRRNILHTTIKPSCRQHRQSLQLGRLQSGERDRVPSGLMFRTALPELGSLSVRTRSLSTYSDGPTPTVETSVSENSGKVDMHEEEVVDGVTLRHGFLNNSDIQLHFVECGDPTGKLVVLLHGWPNFWYVWKNQFKALSQAGYHVLAPDLRGYNLSSKPGNLESYARSAVVGDIVRFIDHFGGGDAAIMVGHDWGSTVSWCLAEDHPSKVEKMVTINMGRLSDFSRILTSNPLQLLRSWYIGAFQIPHVAESAIAYNNCMILRSMLRNLIPNMSDDCIERHVKAYSKPGAIKGGLSLYRAVVQGMWHHSGDVPVVKTPVTVFWGDKDNFLLPVVAETDRVTAPNAKIVLFPQCAHWPMWDDPKLFNELLLETIAEKSHENTTVRL